ncbi:N-acetylmuramidase domain-containing protein [Paracoccus sp. NGMCC 1.201697]|uniref:N-acetylmuramidase domain-containing protein n=1 Tax=Paracoccus broussonetiae subsp. drimophilus TaxID=3373869 RepID=A0ABW7LRE1_9RHOB
MYPAGIKGAAKPLTDIGVARVGRVIGVGQDEIRTAIEVEASGDGFDRHGRPEMLFEPYVFYRELGQGPKRTNLAFTL